MIRLATEDDVDDLVEIAKEFYAEQLHKTGITLKNDDELKIDLTSIIGLENSISLVIVEDDIVVGVISGIITNRMFFEGKIAQELVWFVSKVNRVSGIKLLKEFEKICIEKGCNEIVMVAFNNTHANDIYEKLGYSKLETNYQKRI